MLQTPLVGVTHGIAGFSCPVSAMQCSHRRSRWARWTPSALENIRRKIIMPQPNDKCPCGSGKLYKDCCGKSK
jgi:uncharacterized protein YchJ